VLVAEALAERLVPEADVLVGGEPAEPLDERGDREVDLGADLVVGHPEGGGDVLGPPPVHHHRLEQATAVGGQQEQGPQQATTALALDVVDVRGRLARRQLDRDAALDLLEFLPLALVAGDERVEDAGDAVLHRDERPLHRALGRQVRQHLGERLVDDLLGVDLAGEQVALRLADRELVPGRAQQPGEPVGDEAIAGGEVERATTVPAVPGPAVRHDGSGASRMDRKTSPGGWLPPGGVGRRVDR
jgi:hypothetical protein